MDKKCHSYWMLLTDQPRALEEITLPGDALKFALKPNLNFTTESSMELVK